MNARTFILGLHRSGTTLLYEMLSATGLFDWVTARHVIDFDDVRRGEHAPTAGRARLAQRFDSLGLTSREVDAVSLTPETQEEYGFILHNLGAGLQLSEKNLACFDAVCQSVRRDWHTHRPLLLKNPWDFGRGALICRHDREARIVYIHRNPLHVLSSLFRLTIKALDARHPYLSMLDHRYGQAMLGEFPQRIGRLVAQRAPGLILRSILKSTGRLTDEYLATREGVPPDRAIDVRYEDLVDHPNETISRILEHLRMDASPMDFCAMIGRHRSSVAPEVLSMLDRVIDQLGTYAASTGYDLRALATAENGTGL